MGDDRAEQRLWHQALTYAITGERREDLGAQGSPDVPQLVAFLRSIGSLETIGESTRKLRADGEPWPHPVPADLMSGLGYAQFAAALTLVERELGLTPPTQTASGSGDGHVTAADRRLLDEVPPHHGS